MKPINIKRIENGLKTTTLRTEREKEKIGLEVGESAQTRFGRKICKITNTGQKTVKEAGGKEAIWKSEGWDDSGPSFEHVSKWLMGIGKLYVYEIEDLN